MSPKWADHFTRRAREEGWGARSVFKLEEIQRRASVVRRGDRVVDLGCYPGSWSRYLVSQGVARLVGVDLLAPEGIRGTFLVADALAVEPSVLMEALGGPADLVVSDMAPNTTGNRLGDHVRQLELAARALEIAAAVLKPGGRFVVKVFEGEDAPAFVRSVQARFEEVRRIRPEATRRQSVEFFVVARGFRG